MAEIVKISSSGEGREIRKGLKLGPWKVGRPSLYNQEMADRICEAVATSTRALNTICAERDDFPTGTTVRNWLNRYPEFIAAYARAKEQQMELLADEIMEISDSTEADVQVVTDRHGNKRLKVNGEAVQRSKLKVDTRKWLMAKLSPKRFGDRIDITSAGEQLAAPAQHIDARVQSIVMQAAQRMALGMKPEELEGLDQEARDLLG